MQSVDSDEEKTESRSICLLYMSEDNSEHITQSQWKGLRNCLTQSKRKSRMNEAGTSKSPCESMSFTGAFLN
jgi:hypothetical protein